MMPDVFGEDSARAMNYINEVLPSTARDKRMQKAQIEIAKKREADLMSDIEAAVKKFKKDDKQELRSKSDGS